MVHPLKQRRASGDFARVDVAEDHVRPGFVRLAVFFKEVGWNLHVVVKDHNDVAGGTFNPALARRGSPCVVLAHVPQREGIVPCLEGGRHRGVGPVIDDHDVECLWAHRLRLKIVQKSQK